MQEGVRAGMHEGVCAGGCACRHAGGCVCRRVCVKACRRVCWAGTGMALEEEERERSQRGASIGERGDVHGREAEGRGQVHMVCVCVSNVVVCTEKVSGAW